MRALHAHSVFLSYRSFPKHPLPLHRSRQAPALGASSPHDVFTSFFNSGKFLAVSSSLSPLHLFLSSGTPRIWMLTGLLLCSVFHFIYVFKKYFHLFILFDAFREGFLMWSSSSLNYPLAICRVLYFRSKILQVCASGTFALSSESRGRAGAPRAPGTGPHLCRVSCPPTSATCRSSPVTVGTPHPPGPSPPRPSSPFCGDPLPLPV